MKKINFNQFHCLTKWASGPWWFHKFDLFWSFPRIGMFDLAGGGAVQRMGQTVGILIFSFMLPAEGKLCPIQWRSNCDPVRYGMINFPPWFLLSGDKFSKSISGHVSLLLYRFYWLQCPLLGLSLTQTRSHPDPRWGQRWHLKSEGVRLWNPYWVRKIGMGWRTSIRRRQPPWFSRSKPLRIC